MGPTRRDFEDALSVQDASNLCGVAQSFAEILCRLMEQASAEHLGTRWVNQHPIAVLFIYKMADLAGGHNTLDFRPAYLAVKAQIAEFQSLEATGE